MEAHSRPSVATPNVRRTMAERLPQSDLAAPRRFARQMAPSASRLRLDELRRAETLRPPLQKEKTKLALDILAGEEVQDLRGGVAGGALRCRLRLVQAILKKVARERVVSYDSLSSSSSLIGHAPLVTVTEINTLTLGSDEMVLLPIATVVQ